MQTGGIGAGREETPERVDRIKQANSKKYEI